jgi:hypothetical protein
MALMAGAPPSGARNVASRYQYGRLSTMPGFVPSAITYAENGVRQTLIHANGVADTQQIDSSNLMARPQSLTSGLYNSCTAPTFTQQPVGGAKTGSSGTSPMTYQWYTDDNEPIAGATSATYLAQPTQTTTYYVVVMNACRPDGVASDSATVSVNTCDAPSITVQLPKQMSDGTWTLEAIANGADPLTVRWYRTAGDVLVGTGKIITVGPLSATTSYYAKVTQACSSAFARADVKVTIPLPMTSTALTATRINTNTIRVTWPASAGAAGYVLERRSAAEPEWVGIANLTTTTYDDGGRAQNATYAYRVYALDATGGSLSAVSNADIATTMDFSSVVNGVKAAHLNEILAAVNAVRAAAGWPAVDWPSILAANTALPAPGTTILAAHYLACRARMNEALQALGVPLAPYTDSTLAGVTVQSVHTIELQQRAN